MKNIILVLYIFLLLIFLISSALIFRHAHKYSYLSPRFKTIVSVFGILALTVIIFSLVLLFKFFGSPSVIPIPSSGSSSGGINF